MAWFYVSLTTTRTTAPDLPALLAAVRAATGDPSTALVLTDDGTWRGKKAAEWSPAHIAAAQSALDTTPALTVQLEAQRKIDTYPIELRAHVLAMIDEINILRRLHSLGDRTPAQAMTAIRTKAGTLT
jgi:hypothetical protein